ncbi:hypothetical protein TNCV_4884751, partial [Trichonephila clavipes]
MPTEIGKIPNISLIARKEFRNWIAKDLDPFFQAVRTVKKICRNIVLSFSCDSGMTARLKTYNVHLDIRAHWLYISPRSKAGLGTVEIVKEQLHGEFGAIELTQTRCGITG